MEWLRNRVPWVTNHKRQGKPALAFAGILHYRQQGMQSCIPGRKHEEGMDRLRSAWNDILHTVFVLEPAPLGKCESKGTLLEEDEMEGEI
jgi:hypothetical protein